LIVDSSSFIAVVCAVVCCFHDTTAAGCDKFESKSKFDTTAAGYDNMAVLLLTAASLLRFVLWFVASTTGLDLSV
jgi:hypothetical protein